MTLVYLADTYLPILEAKDTPCSLTQAPFQETIYGVLFHLYVIMSSTAQFLKAKINELITRLQAPYCYLKCQAVIFIVACRRDSDFLHKHVKQNKLSSCLANRYNQIV